MPKLLAIFLCASTVSMTGCGVLRNIEQWKCDNLGMCHFGITPSQPGMQFANPPFVPYDDFGGAIVPAPQFPAGDGQPCPNCPQ